MYDVAFLNNTKNLWWELYRKKYESEYDMNELKSMTNFRRTRTDTRKLNISLNI